MEDVFGELMCCKCVKKVSEHSFLSGMIIELELVNVKEEAGVIINSGKKGRTG